MKFRSKIIVGVASIQALFLMLLIWNGLSALRASNDAELVESTAATAKLFAASVQGSVLTTDLATLDSLVEDVAATPGVAYARVRSLNAVLAEKGQHEALGRAFAADTNLASAVEDRVYDVAADIVVGGKRYGRVEMGFSTDKIINAYNRVRNESMAFAGVSIVLVAFFAVGLGYYLTRQLKELKKGTGKLAEGELGYQIKIRGTDELAQTALAFNGMSSRLKELNESQEKRAAEIRRLNTELEQRVQNRTQQLQVAVKQLEHQALYDALTGIPNRVLFADRFRTEILHANRSKERFALVGVDLDLFKDINDNFGHHAGDLTLQHIAKACAAALRESDTVARMGGDEFYLLLPKVTDAESVRKAVQRVVEAITQPLTIEGKTLTVAASFGVAIYPDHGDDELQLMAHSDAAMYEAKRKRSGIEFYRPELGDGKTQAYVLRSELHHAIANGELVLHYQPKLDLQNRKMTGVEALVRWQHPVNGLLYPDKFIEIAETSGQIHALTVEVVRMVLRQIRAWQAQNITLPVAINISATTLQDDTFPDWIEHELRATAVEPRLVELEVTETAIMTEPLRAIENIKRLAELGVQVSIDDFGTGYSSMAYLQKLLIAKIKIDRTFVTHMGTQVKDEVIVRSTIDLAHNLGLKAVAEGVENEDVWNRLQSLGCDSAQGYFMSKPLPPDKLMEWMQSSPWRA